MRLLLGRVAKAVVAIAVVLAAVGGPLVAPGGAGAQAGPPNLLGRHDREVLAGAVARGDATVTVLIAARRGAARTVVAGLAGLGATIRYRDDDVDYLRAVLPTRQVAAAARLNGIEALNLDEIIPLDDPRPKAD